MSGNSVQSRHKDHADLELSLLDRGYAILFISTRFSTPVVNAFMFPCRIPGGRCVIVGRQKHQSLKEMEPKMIVGP